RRSWLANCCTAVRLLLACAAICARTVGVGAIAAPNCLICDTFKLRSKYPGNWLRRVQGPGPSAGRRSHGPRARQEELPMIDSSRRTVLATGAAAAAASAMPQVFAQTQPAEAIVGLPAGAKVGFYEKGNVRIRYAEIGSGLRVVATAGGGLNSCIAVWARAVINIPEEFKNDFRVITMDQRNATGGESTGPVQVDDPWSAFAEDQLGVMDHLGIDRFFFFGNCIGGPFAMKLMEKAPQ